jgi:hypothetical protein
MMRAKYITEEPVDQPHSTLLDEYGRCVADFTHGNLNKEEQELVNEYVVALRDEILHRMREGY